MKILIDLGHPAHVHYFRNFIKLMEKKGHNFLVSARRRSIIFYLLDHYNIAYYDRGKGKNSVIGKLLYMLIANFRLFKEARVFKPDIFLSFASPYAAQVSWLMGKPHIVLDDTEHAKFGHAFYKPFSNVLLNPTCFKKDFGLKQCYFDSYTELFYLHPNYYQHDSKIYSLLKLNQGEKFVLLRFVSWEANHDIGHSGLDTKTKLKLISILSEKYRVFVSMEGEKDRDLFQPYLVTIPPEKMHDLLHSAEFLISESGTMASEAVIIGTPVVYINSLPLMGYLADHKERELLFHFQNSDGVIEKVEEFMRSTDLKQNSTNSAEKMIESKIDPTQFLVWFIENYPSSVTIIRENPDYQYRFR